MNCHVFLVAPSRRKPDVPNYFTQSNERAKRLQLRKVRQFWKTVVERQNEEFVERALRPDVVFNDHILTGYRDLILYNLENLLAELPDAERKNRMDAAGRAFYCKIMDKRLEFGPDQIQSMLGAKEIQRVLGETTWQEYEKKAQVAIRDDVVQNMALQWATDDLDPKKAEQQAKQTLPDKEERAAALCYYALYRLQDNGRKCFTIIMNIGQVWNVLKNNSYQAEAIPEWVRRNDPDLSLFLCQCLERRNDHGGQPWPVEWTELRRFLQDFSLRECLEQLRTTQACYEWIAMAGGPESDIWTLLLRLLIGKLTKEDSLFLQDMQLVWEQERSDAFMEHFVRERGLASTDGVVKVREIIEKLEKAESGKALEQTEETNKL